MGFLLREIIEIPVADPVHSASSAWIDYIQPLQVAQMGILTGLETIYVAIFQVIEYKIRKFSNKNPVLTPPQAHF